MMISAMPLQSHYCLITSSALSWTQLFKVSMISAKSVSPRIPYANNSTLLLPSQSTLTCCRGQLPSMMPTSKIAATHAWTMCLNAKFMPLCMVDIIPMMMVMVFWIVTLDLLVLTMVMLIMIHLVTLGLTLMFPFLLSMSLLPNSVAGLLPTLTLPFVYLIPSFPS